jgi:hypothetical protein
MPLDCICPPVRIGIYMHSIIFSSRKDQQVFILFLVRVILQFAAAIIGLVICLVLTYGCSTQEEMLTQMKNH